MVFTGDEAPCAVFSFPVVRPEMCDIMAGMDEKDSQTTVAGFAGDFSPRHYSLPRGQAHEAWHHGLFAQKDSYELGSGMSRLVLLVAMHLALCSLR